jgi:flavin-binding protein dodecin
LFTGLFAYPQKEVAMSVAKIIEISCESSKSFEDAIQSGIARAAKTVHGIKGAWVKEQQVVIENNKITLYRVDLKVTFVLD